MSIVDGDCTRGSASPAPSERKEGNDSGRGKEGEVGAAAAVGRVGWRLEVDDVEVEVAVEVEDEDPSIESSCVRCPGEQTSVRK